MAATRKRIIRVSIISLLLICLAIAVPLLAVLNTKVASSRLKGGIQNYEGEIPPDGKRIDYTELTIIISLQATLFK